MHLPIPSVSLSTLSVWLPLIGMGAYHGINPAMGWLFALARGMQQQSTRAIWVALVPIALGHAASIALTAVVILVLQTFISLDVLAWATALLLLGFGVLKLMNWYRHPRWVGMRIKWHELALWSFLMATAHGAGLMVAPVLVDSIQPDRNSAVVQAEAAAPMDHGDHTDHASEPDNQLAQVAQADEGGHSAADEHSDHVAHLLDTGENLWVGVGFHTASMFLTMAAVAWVVYSRLGLQVLRQGWVNFDLIWAVALVVAGSVALAAAAL